MALELRIPKVRMLVNIDTIKTAAVDVAPEITPGRSTRGSGTGWPQGRGRGRRRVARQQDPSIERTGLAAGVQITALHCMFPGRETVLMGVDAVVSLVGVVHCGYGNGYLVGRDSCFFRMSAPTECPRIHTSTVHTHRLF